MGCVHKPLPYSDFETGEAIEIYEKVGKAVKSWCLQCNDARYFLERDFELPKIELTPLAMVPV